MTKSFLVLFINIYFILWTSHAQFIKNDGPLHNPLTSTSANAPTAVPNASPSPSAMLPSPNAQIPTPNAQPVPCYPETAIAYFLPAPPTAPKITVLNPKLNDAATSVSENMRENPLNLIKEVPSNLLFPPPNEMSNRAAFPPPPPACLTGLPDLIDEIPTKMQDRFSRMAGLEEKTPVCETCAALLKKLPIFKFDQELLNGFLSGIGI